MLDGAVFNQPIYDSDKGEKKKSNAWSKMPDRKTNPVEALRWELTESPAMPIFMKLPSNKVAKEVEEFERDFNAGLYEWDEYANNWVRKKADGC